MKVEREEVTTREEGWVSLKVKVLEENLWKKVEV